MNNKTLHMIGNAHIDPVWLWLWQEGFQEVKATFRSALDRLKEDPEFVFTCSSAAFYEWVENNDPEMFEEVRARIAEGRWEVVGGWWIQPDCNIPSGESFVRQGLYGQRYFKEKFGVTATVGYNVDSFGHHGMLPQILKKSGMDKYVFMRPGPHEKGLPGHLFWWESDDGTRVLTFRILYEYCTWGKELDKHIRRCADELTVSQNQLMCFYGVGNHGGGPTKENLASIRRLQNDESMPNLVLSTPNRFFAAIADSASSLPVVHEDLQHHASGCYAAHSGVKQWNRLAENRLITAEKWSILADWTTGQPYPREFTRAWRNVLFNQFHDIMAGTSLEVAYEDARYGYGEAMSIADRALNNAVQSLSWKVNIPFEVGTRPIVAFNPHVWESEVPVEVEMGGLPEDPVLTDDQGHPVPAQRIQSLATSNGRHRLLFVAKLPSLGYRTYTLRPGSQVTERAEPSTVRGDNHVLENDALRLHIDPDTGFIRSLWDKSAGVEVFRGPAARPVVIEDKSDTWSHGIFQFQDAIGEFRAKRIERIEDGPVKSVIRVTSTYGNSLLVQEFSMFHDLRTIDVKVMVDWRERWKMLKLRFPVNLNFTKVTYEVPYGHIERAVNGEEEPGQSWFDMTGFPSTGEQYGLSILNDAKYSFDVLNKEMSITVLRSPIYAHHDPLVPNPDGHYAFIDQGIQHFTYTLLPHKGSWEGAGTVKRAAELNHRPVAIVETYHDGPLPQSDSFVSIDADNVVVSVIKQAEEGDAMVIRAYETAQVETTATIRLAHWNRDITATFGACEIKTFVVAKDALQAVKETNLIEW